MTTVNVKFAATIPVGDFTNLRPEIELVGLDVDQPLEPQLEKCLQVVTQAWETLDGKVEELIVETVSQTAGKPGVKAKIEELESQAATRKANEAVIRDKVQELINIMKEAGVIKPAEQKGDAGEQDA